jgi:hypothetical protein
MSSYYGSAQDQQGEAYSLETLQAGAAALRCAVSIERACAKGFAWRAWISPDLIASLLPARESFEC